MCCFIQQKHRFVAARQNRDFGFALIINYLKDLHKILNTEHKKKLFVRIVKPDLCGDDAVGGMGQWGKRRWQGK